MKKFLALLFFTSLAFAQTDVEYRPIVKAGSDIFRTVTPGGLRVGNTTDTTNGNLQLDTTNAELLGREAGAWKNLTITPIVLSSTTSINTTSATFAVLAGITTTPAAGTYLIFFTADAAITGGDTNGDVQLFVAGAAVPETMRNFGANASFGDAPISGSVSFQWVATVNGSQTIDVRYRENGGDTFNISERALILIPIAR